jgi:hypothetical protein
LLYKLVMKATLPLLMSEMGGKRTKTGRFNRRILCSSSFKKILISISKQVQLPRCVSFERGAMH